ncbi:MAG TPA: thioredoxin family protein [Puia sp.]|nr:thioredoxin family protein [Puia sp.]
MEKTFIAHNPLVSTDEWLQARRDLLQKEKAFTRMRDQLSAERRALPWVRVEKEYIFDSPHGKKTLADLFAGRTQLLIKHFMMGPGWTEGCVGCSFGSDHLDAARIHLENHDVSVVAISRAPLAEIEAFKRRMGWQFRWVSSYGNDFNYDFHVSFTKEEVEKDEAFYNFERRKLQGGEEASGLSVFYKDENGDVFHTYSAFARGDEDVISTYMLLDMTPKGRNENGPGGNLTHWVRHHDKYQEAGFVDHTGRYHAEEKSDCCHGAEEKSAAAQNSAGAQKSAEAQRSSEGQL